MDAWLHRASGRLLCVSEGEAIGCKPLLLLHPKFSEGAHGRGLAATLRVLQGGAVQGSQRVIARALGTSKTTVHGAMRLLAEPEFAVA